VKNEEHVSLDDYTTAFKADRELVAKYVLIMHAASDCRNLLKHIHVFILRLVTQTTSSFLHGLR